MKIASFSTILSLILAVNHAVADVTLNSFANVVSLGQSYELSWTATANYSYTLWLVLATEAENEYDWTRVSSLGTDLLFSTLNATYIWTVPSNLSTAGFYGIWVDAFPIPFDGSSYSTMTEWFTVSASSAPTSSASPSPTASSAPSASSSATSSATSSVAGSSDHHDSLSGGAIAGIVIGVLALIALVIAGVLLARRRKRKSDVEKREAAARAERLAPVMQEGYPDYEMSPTKSSMAKETEV